MRLPGRSSLATRTAARALWLVTGHSVESLVVELALFEPLQHVVTVSEALITSVSPRLLAEVDVEVTGSERGTEYKAVEVFDILG